MTNSFIVYGISLLSSLALTTHLFYRSAVPLIAIVFVLGFTFGLFVVFYSLLALIPLAVSNANEIVTTVKLMRPDLSLASRWFAFGVGLLTLSATLGGVVYALGNLFKF